MYRQLANRAVQPVASTSRLSSSPRPAPNPSRSPSLASLARAPTPRYASTRSTQATSTGGQEVPSEPSHYLVTLLRSPLHLSDKVKATVAALGLSKRLSSVIVPISSVNQGYLVKCKELVGVRAVTAAEVQQWASHDWRHRPGQGKRGSGIRIVEPAGPNSVIRVGSERARGDERGFRVVAQPPL
ncbi:hypothetical protein BMF94_4736 [Rhodotorula taiwanensis]|uniref:Large ribosomal subunit protein uL30-like ferredoxin-like fold domain-containing protein n=1 Tax=Rhodotorula taiwanensis TaxID=741276 RepID=A0A2S5B616_9BASI|nr:hypothetical protein BMF94_4736 [Rhodotorula taiwanensis]